MKNIKSLNQVFFLIGLFTLSFLLIFDMDPDMWWIAMIIEKACGLVIGYTAIHLYRVLGQDNPWIKAYNKWIANPKE